MLQRTTTEDELIARAGSLSMSLRSCCKLPTTAVQNWPLGNGSLGGGHAEDSERQRRLDVAAALGQNQEAEN